MENYDAVFVAVGHREFEGMDGLNHEKSTVLRDLRA